MKKCSFFGLKCTDIPSIPNVSSLPKKEEIKEENKVPNVEKEEEPIDFNCYAIADTNKRQKCIELVDKWSKKDHYNQSEKMVDFFRGIKSDLLTTCTNVLKKKGKNDGIQYIEYDNFKGYSNWRQTKDLIEKFRDDEIGSHPLVTHSQVTNYDKKTHPINLGYSGIYINCDLIHRL